MVFHKKHSKGMLLAATAKEGKEKERQLHLNPQVKPAAARKRVCVCVCVCVCDSSSCIYTSTGHETPSKRNQAKKK